LLKKEARILGLSTATNRSGKTLVVGVVFRGSSWLDGILTCSLDAENTRHPSRIARAIMKSRQYSQLHAVILSREQIVPGRDIDIAQLARRLKLPVIAITKKRAPMKKTEKTLKANYYDFELNGERLYTLATGISHEKTQEVFFIGSTPKSCIPEAARVADLIAEQVTLKWSSLGLA